MSKIASLKVQFRKMLKKGVAKQVQPQILSLSEGFSIQALESGYISKKILEQISLKLSRFVKKGSKVLAHVNADHPITAKPSEVRMGKGKGVIKDWVAKVRQGTIIFQVLGNKSLTNKRFLKGLCLRLPVKVNVINCRRF